ncbi:MAG TPA: hypothetical protein VFL42_00560 [Terriglobales bacterium]|nr:hypothetical protein [Terriglobales bacterium]
MNLFSGTKSAVFLICCCWAVGGFADSINGKVHNKTTNVPAAGDDVVLLRLRNGMEEEARTKTDAQGAFSLPVTASGTKHIVRVLHQGVNYERTVSGTPVYVEVFNAVPTIPGLSGKLGIIQVESEGKLLKITEMYSIENGSSPPVTQLGPHNFEIWLPAKAALESVTAKRAAGLWMSVTPSFKEERKGHYSLDFPLCPGETLFKFIYHLPYQGRATLHLKLPYPIASFGVVHPLSMKFRSSRSQAFRSPGVVQGLRLEQATSAVAGELPAFEISGSGAAPVRDAVAQSPPSPSAELSATQPVASSAPAEAAPNSPTRGIWFVTSAIAALLVAAGLLVLRGKKAVAQSAAAIGGPVPLVAALKEELFQLETERLHGDISAEQYDSTKQALNLSIERASARQKG